MEADGAGTGGNAGGLRLSRGVSAAIDRVARRRLFADAKAGKHGVENILDTDMTGDASE
jgi:hypothetical protein